MLYYGNDIYRKSFAHHGIKGQKWGVNGVLDNEGKRIIAEINRDFSTSRESDADTWKALAAYYEKQRKK